MPPLHCKEARHLSAYFAHSWSFLSCPSPLLKMTLVADLGYINSYHHFKQNSESASTHLLVYPYLNAALDSICSR